MTIGLQTLHTFIENQLDIISEEFSSNWTGFDHPDIGDAEEQTVYQTIKAILAGEATLDHALVAEIYQQEQDIVEGEKMHEMIKLLDKAGYDSKDVGLLHSYLKSNNV